MGMGLFMPDSFEAAARELASIKRALDRAAIVAVTDRAGVIIHVNDKFCEISKYSRKELIGQTHRIIKSNHHPKEFFVDLWKTISSGRVWEGEVCNRAKGGQLYWVNTCIVPFLDESGKPYQYVSIRYEITERKLAEEKLLAYSRRLEESNRELEHFASIAAHDLQEPLRKIRAFSDRLTVKLQGAIPPDAADFLGRIQNSAARMQTLIDDLLSYSRVRTKTQPFTDVPLSEVLKTAVSDLELRIENMKAKVEIGELPVIQADRSQMHQLFLNLLSNALKFQKPRVEPRIVVAASVSGGQCRITVTDNGIGFDEKYLDRIFNIFQRLHGRGEYEGTGVGLAICRRIVDRHHGQITAKSQPGDGAEFIITLPLRQPNGGMEF
jgi:two-component system sensor kinase FixL